MATVWPALHQTLQAAENLGLATACAFSSGMGSPFSDCKGAVRLQNLSDEAQLCPREMFAGFRRAAQQSLGFDALGEAQHAPAHRSDAIIQALPPDQKRIALASQDADRLAKYALSLHPQLAPADLEILDRQVQALRASALMFGKVLSLFPKLHFERPPGEKRLPRVPPPPDWHDWDELSGISFEGESRPMNGCAGLSTALRRLQGAETERQHKLGFAILHKTQRPLFFCFACGAYTSRRCHLLGQTCCKNLSTAGEQVLTRVQAGLHPHYRKNPEGDDSLAPARAPSKSVLLAPSRPSWCWVVSFGRF
ncbi:unnamed protein product [Prorocentrum cordatum]|uniref:Uncharacterized protein n=1 Tax=Prorocentrum cordatum TaxID=2364126 RepID=A0ABN9R8W0_9DINO|nr:unnamed protein product [Polarella glacialis]